MMAAMACMAGCHNAPKTPAIDAANFDTPRRPTPISTSMPRAAGRRTIRSNRVFALRSFDMLRDNNEKRINDLLPG